MLVRNLHLVELYSTAACFSWEDFSRKNYLACQVKAAEKGARELDAIEKEFLGWRQEAYHVDNEL